MQKSGLATSSIFMDRNRTQDASDTLNQALQEKVLFCYHTCCVVLFLMHLHVTDSLHITDYQFTLLSPSLLFSPSCI